MKSAQMRSSRAELAECGSAAPRGSGRPRRTRSPCPTAAARRSAPRPAHLGRPGRRQADFSGRISSMPVSLAKGAARRHVPALVCLALAPPAAAQRFPNVVILTVDTLRADHLSSYGYRRPTTPNIDRLLASGVRFTEARTVEPLTNPALCLDVHLALPARARGHPQRPADAARPALGGADARAARLRERRLRQQLDRSRTASPAWATTSGTMTRSSPASAGSACSRTRRTPRT